MLLFFISPFLLTNGQEYVGEMRRALDAMALTLEGSPQYNEEYFQTIQNCFDSVNPRLIEAQVINSNMKI